MRKLQYILLFFILAGYKPAQAQNLVPNPSFEIYTSCPTVPSGNIYLAAPWFNPTVTSPDYFHSCSGTTVPNNAVGFQYPRTGNAYAGIAARVIGLPQYREYIEVELLDTLKAGKIYCINFYVSLSDSSEIAINKFGLYLSNDSVISSANVLPFIPQIEHSSANMLADKQNWISISGQYVAIGGERFITIGNFYDDANTEVDSLTPAPTDGGYYYIDDVYVGPCDNTPPNDTLIIPNVFTPNGDGINDLFTIQSEAIENITCMVFNRWGIKVAEFKQPGQGWDGRTISGQNAVEGVYYYILSGLQTNGEATSQKGFFQLLK
jgi:gliding motility-associated-like protein